MPTALRMCVYFTFGGVWLSGCAWLVLREFFQTVGEFGVARHPWEPSLLWIHGALAIVVAYLTGWLMARHASEAWRQHQRRLSGGLLTLVIALLSVSGFLLFFVTDDAWQTRSAYLHDLFGMLVTVFAIEHWRVRDGALVHGNGVS